MTHGKRVVCQANVVFIVGPVVIGPEHVWVHKKEGEGDSGILQYFECLFFRCPDSLANIALLP